MQALTPSSWFGPGPNPDKWEKNGTCVQNHAASQSRPRDSTLVSHLSPSVSNSLWLHDFTLVAQLPSIVSDLLSMRWPHYFPFLLGEASGR